MGRRERDRTSKREAVVMGSKEAPLRPHTPSFHPRNGSGASTAQPRRLLAEPSARGKGIHVKLCLLGKKSLKGLLVDVLQLSLKTATVRNTHYLLLCRLQRHFFKGTPWGGFGHQWCVHTERVEISTRVEITCKVNAQLRRRCVEAA